MINKAKFQIGSIVKHKYFDFRGVIFDVDPEFNNTEEWYQSIPMQVRPRKDQPFYHLLAEAPSQPSYVAYVSQQNLLVDESDDPVTHPFRSGPPRSSFAACSPRRSRAHSRRLRRCQ